MSQTVIKAVGLGKKYRIGQVQANRRGGNTLGETIGRWWKGRTSTANSRHEDFWALRELDFSIAAGDTVGIVGRNGAGKSTLLKLISRITEPTTGRLELEGRIASLLEVGTGFHTELTGRENIFLNGAILGMSREEIRQKFDEIVDFSGVEKFLDTPVKRYSSGMYVRLAFAVAAHLEPDVLVIDEVLAVGDAEFQRKCLGKMDDITKKEGRTVLFVSHHLPSIIQLCRKGLFLEQGRLKLAGSIDEIVHEYLAVGQKGGTHFVAPPADPDLPVAIQTIVLGNRNGQPQSEFTYPEAIRVTVQLELKPERQPYSLFVMVLDQYQRRIFAAEKPIDATEMTLQIHPGFLVRGNYSLHVMIHLPQVIQLQAFEDICPFTVIDSGSDFSKHGEYDYGVVFGQYEWQ